MKNNSLSLSCPLPEAVCCDDHEHCCPSGYKCDTKDGRCLRGNEAIPFYKKTAANKEVKSVICPDQSSQCPDQTTCCELATGQWGWYAIFFESYHLEIVF